MSINKLENRQDLEDLFLWLNEPLYKYVYSRCGFNKELAEDITQDIFIKAWDKRDSFNPEKSTLKNWVYVIARNHIIDLYRKKKVIVSTFDEDIFTKDSNMSLEDQSILTDIFKNMSKLKETEQEILLLRYVQDLDIEEISNIVGKSKTNTKVMIHRAIKKLKSIMNS